VEIRWGGRRIITSPVRTYLVAPTVIVPDLTAASSYEFCAGVVGGRYFAGTAHCLHGSRRESDRVVTGAAGFMARELIKVLVARGHRVLGLAESVQAAERVRRAGGAPVTGDLLQLVRGRNPALEDDDER
jgi:hypothetical protein